MDTKLKVAHMMFDQVPSILREVFTLECIIAQLSELSNDRLNNISTGKEPVPRLEVRGF